MKKLERIILVDDDTTTNFYNELILSKIGVSKNIEVFQNGKNALEYLKKGNKVDLILLDINMPIMNGWQFIEEYEKLDTELQSSIIVVMLTASVNINDMKEAERHRQIKKYINKPITKEVLQEILTLFE